MDFAADRQELYTLLDDLSDEQIHLLVQFIKSIQRPPDRKRSYNPDTDPLVGFISGPTDVAEHVEEILYGEEDTRSE